MTERHERTLRDIWLSNGGVWLGLVLLLALTATLAYAPLGALNGPISLLIAALKALLVLGRYMELKAGRPLVRLIAFVPVVFVAVLFMLTLADVITRY